MLGLLVAPFGCGSSGGSGATPVPTMGTAEIGFIDSPSSGFQQIVLNVQAIRLNPSTDPNVSETDPNWVTINAPAGAGAAGELAVDLNAIQNNARVFNTQEIPAQTYHQIELLLDPNTPGTIIPNCPKTAGPLEGCIPYNVAVTPGTGLRLLVSQGIPVTANGFTPLVLDLSVNSIQAPTAPGGIYILGIGYNLAPTSVLASLSGTVTASSGSLSKSETVSAELTGTNQVVAHTPLTLSSSTQADFNLTVPAATNGTAYDLYVSGGNATYDSLKAVMATRNGSITSLDFSVKGQAPTRELGGTITDSTSGAPIAGATVNLLQAPSGSSADCAASPVDCVVMASTATTAAGQYGFGAPDGDYTVQIENTGTDTVLSDVTVGSGTLSCSGATTSGTCDFALTSTTISGTLTLAPPPASGTNKLITIMAEKRGTTQLEGINYVTVPSGVSSVPFTIQVPTGISAFDLIATSQDTYLGVPTQYTGHTIGVAANVQPGASPDVTLTCGGHGSIVGAANSSDAGTQIILSMTDPSNNLPVELMETGTGPATDASGNPSPNANAFSFCAPPGAYQLQRMEVTQVGPTSTASPVGTPQAVDVPTPAPTSSPCPSTCDNSDGSCPGVCGATLVNPL